MIFDKTQACCSVCNGWLAFNFLFLGKVMNAYKKLKSDYEHLINRTMDLFKYGKDREYKLETTVANAWKQFGEIADMTNDQETKTKALQAQLLMSDALKEDSIAEFILRDINS